MNTVYIGLGANLNAPEAQLRNALDALNTSTVLTLAQVSSFYASKPMGPQDQPDYVNAVAKLITDLPAIEVLDLLQQIELQHGRVRKAERWGPRTLDLDILLYNDAQIATQRLIVPHYGLCEREFVVFPLLEIAPGLTLPTGQALADIATTLPRNGLTAISQYPVAASLA
ncbi:2-amino-4-hydroxy-6-hydroxymethyldihydropteridine diphosphokinase [Pseudoalteromonas rubra]|uniref:2-amino-4-hydroxy-6-hydroxymethyldihydropteridine pyrophosphokinase n=1 Tax=Pseudoalteromonas rubra TaxID=43658 RepID=A0A0U3GE71_9GAMM|nr:2-amino-4-hydroxy-6-hydroxymethyldihydropteridine diphosphokinase [Pseudoalteromonas rubra]ALU43130.1 2-amino-4-hydroxy-6-hydroxymethyldihydropteridine pyrophosphokinase [Pseudoalteromonas rubra]